MIWVIEENLELAIRHLNSAFQPKALRTRFDLSLWYRQLKNDFTAFKKHCMELSETFQMIDIGPFKSKRTEAGDCKKKKEEGSHLSTNTTESNEKRREQLRSCRFVSSTREA